MKIFITRPIPEKGIQMLAAKGYEVKVNEAANDRPATKAEVIDGVRGADALLSVLTEKIPSEIIEAGLPALKVIANYAVGFDNVDVAYAKKSNILVTNAPSDEVNEAVAEHTFALMLALARRIVDTDRLVLHHKYHAWGPSLWLGTGLAGKVLGIVGPGRIGTAVGKHAEGFGMKVVFCGENDSIDDFLPKCDFISLHVPLLDSTYHLINEARLKKMKPTAYLINTSRGSVIDEQALADALKKGVIRGAGLDVFEHEPKVNPDLLKLENVVLTPHTASATVEARTKMAEVAATNIIEALEGRTPPNICT